MLSEERLSEHRNLLNTISQISRKLLMVHSTEDLNQTVPDCLALLGNSTGKGRLYIWKNYVDSDGRAYCKKIYIWSDSTVHRDNAPFELYYDEFPSLQALTGSEKCLNRLLRDFSGIEKKILESQGILAILISPIIIRSQQWGYIGIDNCNEELLFSGDEQDILMTSGSLIASAIEKTETETALREAEERTQLMLDAMPLCYNLWTPEFQNIRCNDEAVRLFKLSSQEEYLARFFDLSPQFQPCGKSSQEMAHRYITKAFAQGYCRFEWMHQKLDGTPIPAEIILVRIKYKDGIIVAGYTRDLREEKAMLEELKTKEALRIARDQALMNSKAKSNFLANMSHEIRTPMNAISGFADILLRENQGGATAKYAESIKSASNNLLSIINDILDISKIESGKFQIYNAPYELAPLINDVISISRMRLGDKPLLFITDIDSRLPARLIGDEIRMKQILLNIISNAIKYTNEGYFAVSISSSVKENTALVRFTVKDSGIGIKEQDLGELFDEFKRINTTKNRNVEGTGLGLTITKQLCEMMGGHIEVQSTYGKGSEFTVTVMQECPSYEPIIKVKGGQTILLYEPRELYRHSIENTLKSLNCNCVSCANQSELYEKITELSYNYILTSALYLKKVKTLVDQKKLPVPVAAFLDYNKTAPDKKIYTIPFPVNCLGIAALLNGQCWNTGVIKREEAAIVFTAPSARILLVDDNSVNLEVARGLMTPYQFEIDAVLNGPDAIEKVKQKKYDLVFMDHMMPGMDGIDTTIAIRGLRGEYYQNLPIIALTANVLVGTKEMFIHEGMNDFLAKPIDPVKLARLLIKWLPQSKVNQSAPSAMVIQKLPSTALNIAGIDVIQGIRSIGGSEENYMKILSAYHADGIKMCASLRQHITDGNIAAFRTEIHALKSTSAAIGASYVSELAAKLEIAAQCRDASLIRSNINEFMACFEELLKAILSKLPENRMPPPAADERPEGDTDRIIHALPILKDALELANISRLEDTINELSKYRFSDSIAQELDLIKECLDEFNYDGALECVTRLNALFHTF